ncbi:transposase [Streptomyces sp. NPDC057743]|uniref:transposase n=1 Tax=Streptomyces sp. NPDC057743 TaxID=3346236 RepID=UPI00367F77D7
MYQAGIRHRSGQAVSTEALIWLFGTFREAAGQCASRTRLRRRRTAPTLLEVLSPGRLGLMPAKRKYSYELRERAVRMAFEIRKQTGVRTGTIARVADQLGVNREAVRSWVRQAEVDGGKRLWMLVKTQGLRGRTLPHMPRRTSHSSHTSTASITPVASRNGSASSADGGNAKLPAV